LISKGNFAPEDHSPSRIAAEFWKCTLLMKKELEMESPK
jgi:hypothetical protein